MYASKPTIAAAGRNGPLAPHMRPCAPRRHFKWMGDNPPSLRMYSLGGLRVFMALKALLCSGDDELPQYWSVLRAINTLNSPQNTSASSGACHPSIQSIGAERNASCGALGGNFHWWRPWLFVAVVTPVVFCGKATENCNQNTKITCLLAIISFITI